MNLLEMLKDAIHPFGDGKKPPLHVGEVMNLWFYLTATEQTLRGEQVSYNTAQDQELRDKIEDVINNVHLPIREELKDFLRSEGVPLPNATPDKSIGDFRAMPENAKLSDEEIANLLSFNIVLGINYACRGLTEATRPDVASMFAKFQMKKAAFALTFRQLMTEKGWLLVPPAYHAGSEGRL
ncbi:DUF3231 family protein [Paenibacillus aurantiacus]|uniref:DUF3231 family protein n=1 Tax=Paenibacillus aurantiacus TaxID=1936118 RepID=A0ABV5KS53_9BACL